MKKFQQSMHNSKEEYFDVIIAGAGPSGCSCALALSKSGLNVALIDKSDFPRVKVCGDAITYRAVKILEDLDPTFVQHFSLFENKSTMNSARFISRRGTDAFVHWNKSTYNCKRSDFDNYLLDLALKEEKVTFIGGCKVNDISVHDTHVELSTEKGLINGKIVVGCDGAQSIIARKIFKNSLDRNHHSLAVRGYFRGVKELEIRSIEFFFTKKFAPSYFWIFPVNKTDWNVGFGKMPNPFSKKTINLRKGLLEILEENPELKERFSEATLIGKIEGFGLPIGSKKRPISGHRFLLCGDAASLVDPMWGNGIDNGLESGRIAAKHIIKHIPENKFTAEINVQYDQLVYKKLGKELRFNTWLLRAYSISPWIMDLAIFLLSNKNPFQKRFQKLFS